MLGLLLAGCGGSQSDLAVGPETSPAAADEAMVSQAMVDDPRLALRLVPWDHLDPLSGVSSVRAQSQDPSVISVADLQSDYEILFASLSEKLGVTESTPEAVANIDFIKSQDETGNFDLLARTILNNPAGVTAVRHQPVSYSTTVPLPQGSRTFQVSGGVLLPQGIARDELRGVIVYFHGTTFSKNQVGSNLNNPETQLSAQVFASQGYVVLIPDYVGQGQDWQNVHPYVLYPRVSAQTAVDMLAAVKPTLLQEYALTEQDALKLFSVGYSEGGSYALWFNTYLREFPALQDPFYRLTHSVGLEGAYSTSESIYDYLFNDVSKLRGNPYRIQQQALVNIVKPILSADAFLSYACYSQAQDYASIFNPEFFSMTATPPVPQAACNVEGQQVDIASAFARPATNITVQLLASGLGKSANGSSYPTPLTVRFSTANSVKSLVSSEILTESNMAELMEALRAADADLDLVADQGVSVITLDQDSVVVPTNFDKLLARYPGKIRHAITIDHSELKVVSPFSAVLGRVYWTPIDHMNAPVYQYLYALHIFNGF